MDTFIKPREISLTESEESISEKRNSLTKFSLKTAKLYNDAIRHKEWEQQLPKFIVRPTARYLEINQKKVSSFDLLVHPPKRQRLHTPSTTSTEDDNEFSDNLSYEDAIHDDETETSSYIEETDYPSPTEDPPVLNCQTVKPDSSALPDVEKTNLLYRQQGWDNNPTQSENLLKHLLEKIEEVDSDEVEEEKHDKIKNNEEKANNNNGESTDRSGEKKTRNVEFPCTANFVNYIGYSQKFSLPFDSAPFPSLFNTVNEKDENKNFLTNSPNKLKPNEILTDTNKNRVMAYNCQTLPSNNTSRKIKKARYKLKRVPLRKNMVNLCSLQVDSFHDILTPLAPNKKRRKLNAPGEFTEEEQQLLRNEPQIVYQICNELTHQSATLTIVGTSSSQFSQGDPQTTLAKIIDMRTENEKEIGQKKPMNEKSKNQKSSKKSEPCTRTLGVGDDTLYPPSHYFYSRFSPGSKIQQDMFPDENSRIHSAPPFSVIEEIIPCPDLNDNLNGNASAENEVREDKITFIPSSVFHSTSPITIFLAKSDSGSELEFPFPFMNLLDNNANNNQSESEVRIEDVTDKCPVNAQSFFQLVFPPTDPVLDYKESNYSRQLDSALRDFNGYGVDSEHEDMVQNSITVKDETKQEEEVLLQPKPHLTLSSSRHSLNHPTPYSTAVHDSNCRARTLNQFMEKRRKSDFFVGKLRGLSKSIMKLYKTVIRSPPPSSSAYSSIPEWHEPTSVPCGWNASNDYHPDFEDVFSYKENSTLWRNSGNWQSTSSSIKPSFIRP